MKARGQLAELKATLKKMKIKKYLLIGIGILLVLMVIRLVARFG